MNIYHKRDFLDAGLTGNLWPSPWLNSTRSHQNLHSSSSRLERLCTMAAIPLLPDPAGPRRSSLPQPKTRT